MADGVVLRLNADPSSGLPEYAAQHERFFAAVGMAAVGNSGLAVREGKRLGPGLEVTINADGLSVDIQPGLAVVQHALTNGGDYHVAIPTAVNVVLAAKPGVGLKRRDLVVIDVLDEDTAEKPTLLREANIEVLEGTNTAGTPVAPAAGLMRMQLATVHFDGTDAPIIQPTNIPQTWAAGGIGVVYSESERDNLTVYDGMKVYRDDLSAWQHRRDGAWEDEFFGPEDTGWLLNVDGTVFGNYPLSWNPEGSRIRRIGNRVRFEVTVEREGGTLGPGNFTDEPVHTITDPTFLAGGAGPLFAVGHGGGGTIGFRLDGDTLWATSSQFSVAPLDIVRVAMEWLTD